MTIAVTAPLASYSSSTNATSYTTSGSFTPAANSLIVVYVAASGTVDPAPVLQGDLLTPTLKHAITYNGGVDTLYVFYAQASASPSSTALVFVCVGDASTGVAIVTHQITGCVAGPGDPFVQSATNTGSGTAPGVTFGAALQTLNAYLLAVGISRSAPGATPPSGWTNDGEDGHFVPNNGAAYANRVNGETGTAYAFTTGSGQWACVGLEVAPSAASILRQMMAHE